MRGSPGARSGMCLSEAQKLSTFICDLYLPQFGIAATRIGHMPGDYFDKEMRPLFKDEPFIDRWSVADKQAVRPLHLLAAFASFFFPL